ncbi:GRIP and coiled-coil domain-containing protein 2 [Anopheles nili]|uniref:GRIP and coiled-coil domain-containing protein 2 n=1 Tax=Anopheles nili TaxID=185578 RepID=UPI00237B3155|nr:GRIP and coiled-coil domain-containing protein 2 [Anopheles nili]
MSTGQGPDQMDSARKPSPFDNLSREDLVKKCKGLLGIAQKAKQAKDECQAENQRLKEQLNHFETQKNADKECIKAMQEVADSYMDQKLQATMKVDELEKQIAKLISDKSSCDKKNEELRTEIDQLNDKITILERDAKATSDELLKELQDENGKLEKERIALEQELIKVKGSQTVLGDKTMTSREEKLVRKLKLYKAKVQEINAKLLLLKSDRKILLKTVKEYSEQVPKWQKDLVNASNVLFEKIRTLELERSDLHSNLKHHELMAAELSENNAKLQQKIIELMEQASHASQDESDGKGDSDNNKKLVEELEKQIHHLKAHASLMETEKQQQASEYECKLSHNTAEMEMLRKDFDATNEVVLELKTKIQSQGSCLSENDETMKSVQQKLNNSIQQVECYETQIKKLQEQLETQIEAEKHYKQLQENFENDVADLKSQLKESQNEQVTNLNVLRVQLSQTEEQLVAMKQEKEILVKKLAALESDVENQKLKLAEENRQILQKMIVENQNLEFQLAQLADKLKGSIENSKQISKRCETFEKEAESAKLEAEKLNSEKNYLLEKLSQIQIQNEDKQEELMICLKDKDNKITELEQRKDELYSEVENLKEKAHQNEDSFVRETQSHVQNLEEQLSSLNSQHDRLKSENGELLSELKEINEMLKDRGEVINLQLSKISELQEKLSRTETIDIEPFKQQIKDLQKTVLEKDAELEKNRDELAAAMNRSNMSFDAQSDVMSTSTISRVEDVARLREIDESFEEKYIKLRSLAVKLKKKVAEQTVLIQKYERDSSAGSNVISDSLQQTANKNLQSLQIENDRLQDQLDIMKQEEINLREELTQKTIELSALEQVHKDISGSNKDRNELESAVKEYQTQIQSLKREKEAFQMAKREIDAENQRLKSSLVAKEKELTDGLEQQKELKSEIERTKLAVKKANVLTLEMEAYERSLAELNSKLETKKMLVKELEETIDVQEQSFKSLKQQMVQLEENLESEQKHAHEFKQEADTLQGKLRQSEQQRQEVANQLEELRDQHERLKQRVENNRVEVEQVAAEKEKVCGSLEIEKNALHKQNLLLDSELNALRKEMITKQQEVDDVRTEFASYKIRAQSVLRQNQNKDSSREKELEEEVNQLQRSLDTMESKHQALVKQVSNLSKNNEELRNEKERTQNRCKDLLALLEESRIQNDSMMEESRKANHEHQEALKTHRIQNETLIQCYKKQLEEQQTNHTREMEQLRKTERNRSEESSDATGLALGNVLNNNSHALGGVGNISGRAMFSDEQRINLLLMEREDGEGSESTNLGTGTGAAGTSRRKLSTSSSIRGRNNREVIPLDELLNSSFDDSASVVVADGAIDQLQGSMFGRESSPTLELQHTKEQLTKQESRVRHLTALLAEAEQDLAKLTQLNELLKEEVRRQQRSIEREAHVHNSEYLKNVIFKFITLNNGDERSRLVPVLNTILKLSPEETQKLQNVANGSDAGARGWTGLLWS